MQNKSGFLDLKEGAVFLCNVTKYSNAEKEVAKKAAAENEL